MPKLKMTEEEQQYKNLLVMLAYYKELTGTLNKELALAAGINLRTYYERLENPGTFRLCELQGIARKLRTSVNNLLGAQINAIDLFAYKNASGFCGSSHSKCL